MLPTPLTEAQRGYARLLAINLLDTHSTPAELADYLQHLAGNADAGLRLLNEARDVVETHLASVALLLRTNRSAA